jgi:hypothetical protein
MRKITTLFLFLFTNILFAQSDVLVVYIDASSSGNKLKEIQSEVKELVSDNADSEVLIFISNGESPLITSERSEVSKTLTKLRSIYVSAPDINTDIIKINKELLSNDYISDIRNITLTSGLKKSLTFHFYFDNTDYKSLQLEKQMILPLLLSNRLIHKESLQEKCKVYLHLGENDDPDTDINEEKFKIEKYK